MVSRPHFLIDASQPDLLARYLVDLGLIARDTGPLAVERAGDGNMNLTLRVRAGTQSFIVKQGRPWVEKYPQIPAPHDRSLVEGAFYETVAAVEDVARRMPRLLRLDAAERVLVLEDVVGQGDFTDVYAGARCTPADLEALLLYLVALHRTRLAPSAAARLANRDMRVLNHEHIFRFPLDPANGLELDGITPGLATLARALMADANFVRKTVEAGRVYLDGEPRALVHGDFFPGSWLRTSVGPFVIDPEFCFTGRPEFDVGVMAAHLAFARVPEGSITGVVSDYAARAPMEARLVDAFAGVEIMRRLIGVAQLPLERTLDEKRELLDFASALVCGRHGLLSS